MGIFVYVIVGFPGSVVLGFCSSVGCAMKCTELYKYSSCWTTVQAFIIPLNLLDNIHSIKNSISVRVYCAFCGGRSSCMCGESVWPFLESEN